MHRIKRGHDRRPADRLRADHGHAVERGIAPGVCDHAFGAALGRNRKGAARRAKNARNERQRRGPPSRADRAFGYGLAEPVYIVILRIFSAAASVFTESPCFPALCSDSPSDRAFFT